MALPLNSCSAAAALLSNPAIDPKTLSTVHGVRGATIADVGDDAIPFSFEDIGLHISERGFSPAVQFLDERGYSISKGMDVHCEGHLAFVDIAKAG